MAAARRRAPATVVWIVALALAGPVVAMWGTPAGVPLTRLLPNLERAVQERPRDAAAHFVLGRVHGYAYATSSTEVSVRRAEGSTAFSVEIEAPLGPWQQHRERERPIGDVARTLHLDRALRHLRRAVELDPAPAEHHLGLAYVLDVGAEDASRLDSVATLGLLPADLELAQAVRVGVDTDVRALASAVPAERHAAWRRLADHGDRVVAVLDAARRDDDPAVQAAVRSLLTERWRAHAAASYLRAFELARAIEPVGDELPPRELLMGGLREQFISYEAAEAWLRLRERQPPADEAEAARRAEMAAFLAHVEKAPPAGVTPIVFSLQGAHAVSDLDLLLDPECIVEFDLDGDLLPERRPWLRPDTALLCWDPDGTGTIRSGRQLFGNVTWWMFFRDGYHALDALDDDRDGWLTGAELAGLAVWRDADQDAVSDPGEVVDLHCAGVEALSVRPTARVGVHPANPEGLRLCDGRLLPTWDWVAPPVLDGEILPGR